MRFWNTLRNRIDNKPKNATEFIQKFISDSWKSRVQLEIIRNNEIILQVDFREGYRFKRANRLHFKIILT